MKQTILLVEDEKIMRIALEDALKAAGYHVFSFETGQPAMRFLDQGAFDLAVTDVRLPDIDGFEIVKEITRRKDVPIIVMTAYGTIENAVEAMKLGAFDYITKPFVQEEFLLLIERALELKRLREENIRLRKAVDERYRSQYMIGETEEMKKVFSLIEKVSASDATVLIEGESGTGKELVATTIHYQSRRKDNPIIKVNCAALPEGLIESEMFGHEKGAFTGAVRRKPGRFELANGGTIFLDEIGDLPLSTQAKILRVIQEMEFERVGGIETISVDVRIIAATNRDLKEEVNSGHFREDLYYRVNVIPISLPPLRERREDIPGLLEFFTDKYRKKLSRNIRFSQEAVDALLVYDYPGNIRELENIIERCITLSATDMITREELPVSVLDSKQDPKTFLSHVAVDAEKAHIVKVLKATHGNKTRAAEILGISRKTLWEKIKAYGIEHPT